MELVFWVIGLIALMFLLPPLLSWTILGEDAAPRFDVFDPSRHPAPPEITTFIRENLAPLTAEGLHLVGDMIRERPIMGAMTMSTRVAIVQHADGVVGTVTVTVMSAAQGNVSAIVEFTAELSDGRVLDVNNTETPATFAVRQGHVTYRLPQVRDPLRLYRIFRLMLRRHFGAATLRRREVAADPARFLAQLYDEAHHWQVEAGYFRLDRKANRYRPTLKGAYLMTWKMLPPFGQLRRAAVRRRARALLEQIGMEEPDQQPIVAPRSVAPAEHPEPVDATPRGTDWPGILLWVGIVSVFAASFAINRFVGGFVSIVVLFGGMLGLLWLAVRRVGGGRVIIPMAALMALVLGMAGYRKYTSRLPGLTVPADFVGAIQALEKVTGQPVTKLEGHDSVYVVRVRTQWANRFLNAAVPKFAARHFFLSRFDLNFRRVRSDTSTVRLVLVPVLDPFDVLRLIGTHGEVDGQTTDSIAAGLRALNAEQPFEFLNIGLDWVRGAFNDSVANPRRMAQRFTALCPRVLAEDYHGNVELLETRLGRGGVFICRWR